MVVSPRSACRNGGLFIELVDDASSQSVQVFCADASRSSRWARTEATSEFSSSPLPNFLDPGDLLVVWGKLRRTPRGSLTVDAPLAPAERGGGWIIAAKQLLPVQAWPSRREQTERLLKARLTLLRCLTRLRCAEPSRLASAARDRLRELLGREEASAAREGLTLCPKETQKRLSNLQSCLQALQEELLQKTNKDQDATRGDAYVASSVPPESGQLSACTKIPQKGGGNEQPSIFCGANDVARLLQCADSRRKLQLRSHSIGAATEFLRREGFLEVDTPSLVQAAPPAVSKAPREKAIASPAQVFTTHCYSVRSIGASFRLIAPNSGSMTKAAVCTSVWIFRWGPHCSCASHPN